MMKASGHAALIVLAGLFLLFGGQVRAAPSAAVKPDSAGQQADTVKPGKHRRHDARRSSNKTAQKFQEQSQDKAGNKDAAAKTDVAKVDTDAPASSQMPPEVANANAQLAAADTPPASAASAMAGRASDNVQADGANAESEIVAPDQLNDIDRAALQQDNPPQKAVVAATDAQPRPAPVMASQQSSAWDQSSLIGKIFIGVGTLLTLASAARMFMA